MTGETVEEEFEPLFDYRRVQPNFICLDDDDSDQDCIFIPKRRKISGSSVEKADKSHIGPLVINCEDEKEKNEDDEENWLPPPPKFDTNAKTKIEEYPVLKELRLMQQELQSFAQSAEDLLQSEENSVQRTDSSLPQSLKDTSNQPLKPPCERAKIVISLQDRDGMKQFRVFLDEKFERLFKSYANKIKISLEKLVFIFDGDKINPLSTPENLGMEDNDIIEVHVKSN